MYLHLKSLVAMASIVITIITCLVLSLPLQALDNGLALRPPMGWMSWQRFRCAVDCNLYPDECISDNLIRQQADLMASDGYLQAGYEYLVIDDCWLSTERDENGKLQPDPERFPNGMKDLADYIHGKGLKFGMYEDIGTHTCAGYPGIQGHLEVDAKTFAEWEIDYIKIDGCNKNFDEFERDYTEFGRYLNETGRPIVYSCSWPAYIELKDIPANYSYLMEICNLWRNWGDIDDSYESLTTIIDWFSANQDRFIAYAGPGHWNDPDMLLAGNFGLSYEQSKSQMALWAIMAAPLLMSVDLRTITPKFRDLLLHEEVIDINQDVLGIQGGLFSKISNIEVWIRLISPIINGSQYSYALAFQSRREDGTPFSLEISLDQFGLGNANGYLVRDVFDPQQEDQHVEVQQNFTVRIKPSGAVLYRLTPSA